MNYTVCTLTIPPSRQLCVPASAEYLGYSSERTEATLMEWDILGLEANNNC